MTTPDVPLRMEVTLELPGTPELVWDAIATGAGISSWMLPTELDARLGGDLLVHMGPDMSSPGRVTGWDPPRRFAYEEPEWAALAGHAGADVSPMATEFLVEAASGGTCVVRVVTSAFGTGAQWEQEFWEEMVAQWAPGIDVLRLYLTHFPGQHATTVSASTELKAGASEVWSALHERLGGSVGAVVSADGHEGTVEQSAPQRLLLRLTAPVPGFVSFYAFDRGDGTCGVGVEGQLFSPEAPAVADAEREAWTAWLSQLDVDASPDAGGPS